MDLCNSTRLPLALPELRTRAEVSEQIRIAREPIGVPCLRLHPPITEIRLDLGFLRSQKLIDEVTDPRGIKRDGKEVREGRHW